ncbi:MAG TPA: Hsp70 family protein [Bryobacteraceae bacterium]|nr:Hsp70 family protein [Bryobacteraceae bacterium]
MKLGIDFGTNRTVVAAADRGNYPLVSFESPDGTTPDWFPSLVALCGNERRYGWDAWETQTDFSWTIIRSIKRLLEDAGPRTQLDLGDQQVALIDLLQGFTSALYSALRDNSNLRLRAQEPLEIVLGVPAHANSNQRFLTVEAFRAAGFRVLGVLNEPSAASIEFGHRQKQSAGAAETILVYDLGGGTFDASLVTLDQNVHHVLASEGISTIGGDDFDQLLAELALEAAGVSKEERDELSAPVWFRLLDECRRKKESLHPNSRKLVIDLEHANPDWSAATVSVADFYDAARPLVEETIQSTEDLLSHHSDLQFEALYLTGGASELPLVARVLKERFGRRVRRSAHTRSATAIGVAIQADQPETYRLSERLQRSFGVWREADAGSRIVFDPILEKGTVLPSPGEPLLAICRRYSPAHNIGHFRFLECSHTTAEGAPSGEVTFWDEIRFPFDPHLAQTEDLSPRPVRHSRIAATQVIEERYQADSGGSIRVVIANETAGYERQYQLGHWSNQTKSVKPAQRTKRARA